MGETSWADKSRTRWSQWLVPDRKADGEWWAGWCPLHDQHSKGIGEVSALFNFQKGVMRCLSDSPCHGQTLGGRKKRVISLFNVTMILANGGVSGDHVASE